MPTHLKLEIEDYGGDDKRAHFCWADPQDENIGIIVELGPDGELESLSRDIEPESGERLSEEKLEDIMRQFVETHHPGALSAFVREENDRAYGDKVRFSYVQMEAGLPLPMSGFMADVSLSGEIVYFRYYGEAGSIIKPKRVADVEEALAFIKKDVEFDLLFQVLHRSRFTKTEMISRIWCMSLNVGRLPYLRIWFKKNKEELMMTMITGSRRAFLSLYSRASAKRPILTA